MTTCNRCNKAVGTNEWDIHTCTPKPGLCDDCETVSHCLKHGCIPKHQALEQMAQHARELGLDYEQYKDAIEVSVIFHEGQRMFAVPKQVAQTLPFGVGGGLVAIKTLLSRDPCGHANTAIQMIDAILAEQPAQQQTWKQGGLVTLNQDPYPAMGAWFVQFWEGEEVAARVYGNDRETLGLRCSMLNAALQPPAQRKPLTLGQKQRLWSSVGDKPTLKDRVNAYGLAIEAAHNIKENT